MLMRTPQRWVRPKRVHPPGFIVPCSRTLAAKVPDGDGWLHELLPASDDGEPTYQVQCPLEAFAHRAGA
jgi:hypothetical protein